MSTAPLPADPPQLALISFTASAWLRAQLHSQKLLYLTQAATKTRLDQFDRLRMVEHGGARRRRGARQHDGQPAVVELAVVVDNGALRREGMNAYCY